MIEAVLRALSTAVAMGWEILWPLILGFALSAAVQAVVSKQQMSQLLPDDQPRSIGTALALGAASSSCSYAAVALARSQRHHDDAELQDEIGGSHLERHRGSEIRAPAEDRAGKRHCGVRARRRSCPKC